MEIAQLQLGTNWSRQFVTLRLSWHGVLKLLRLGTNWSWKSQTLISSLIFLFFGLPTLFHRFPQDFRFTFLRKLSSSSISQVLIVWLLWFHYSSSNHNLCFLYGFHSNIDWFFYFFLFFIFYCEYRDCKAQSKRLLVLVVWEMCSIYFLI